MLLVFLAVGFSGLAYLINTDLATVVQNTVHCGIFKHTFLLILTYKLSLLV